MKRTVNDEIDRLLLELSNREPGSDAYLAVTRDLEVLYKARSHKNESGISPDTMLLAAVSITEILVVLYYERVNVVTSRALNWMVKLVK